VKSWKTSSIQRLVSDPFLIEPFTITCQPRRRHAYSLSFGYTTNLPIYPLLVRLDDQKARILHRMDHCGMEVDIEKLDHAH
jgi:hypothetical protein